MDFYEGTNGGEQEETAAPAEPRTKPAVKSETALLPKSLLGPEAKPGDSVTLKVVHVYEDEVEVAYQKEQASGPPAPSGFAEEIDQLANQE